MKVRSTVISLMLVTGFTAAPALSATGSGPKVMLSVEPVLVDADGLHPMTGTTDDARVELGIGGAHFQTVMLEDDRSDLLIYKLSYQPLPGDRIKLKLERSRVRRGQADEVLPPQDAEISVLEMWSATLLDDSQRKRRLVLRVVPELRVQTDDEQMDSSRFLMHLADGPLVRFGARAEDDRVVFRAINAGGAGLEFGIPGFGVVRIHLRPFPGATQVGRVLGTTMYFKVGGQGFQAWSAKEILPEDPARPGTGWILYGALLPPSAGQTTDGYYGNFQPGK